MKVVSKSLVRDKSGKILVLRRSTTHPSFPHHFDFPGGEVEEHEESYELAAVREIEEETGLHLGTEQAREVFRRDPTSSLRHTINLVNIDEIAPSIKLSWEHDAYYWLTVDELLQEPLPENPDSYYLDVIEFLDLAGRS